MNLLKRIPLHYKGELHDVRLINFTVDMNEVQHKVPAHIKVRDFNGRAMISMVDVKLKNMRPVMLPFVRFNYRHVAFRLLVDDQRYNKGANKGIFFFRSFTDKQLMVIGSQLLTDYNLEEARIEEVNNQVVVSQRGQIEATGLSSFYKIHVELTKRIIEYRQTIGNPRIIQISAIGAFTEHQVEFLRTKGEADSLLLQQPQTIVVRPSIVCTHRTMIVKKILMLSNIARFSFGLVTVPKGFLKTRIQPIMPQDLVDLVENLCSQHEYSIVNAVGPEPMSFREIITMMLESKNQKMRLVEISKAIMEMMVNTFVSPVFPNIINGQQYQLLFYDNIADEKTATQILGRSLISTRQFFKDEFYASN